MASFESEVQGKLLILRCPPQITGAMTDQIEMLTKSTWLNTESETVVFDFKGVELLSEKAYRPLIQYRRQMAAQRKKIFSIHVSMALKEQMMRDGMINIFNPVENLAQAVDERSPHVKAAIDASFFGFFADAIRKTFETQVKLPVDLQRAVVGSADKTPEALGAPKLDVGVASTLTLDAQEFYGALILAFPTATYLGVLNAMIGESHSSLSAENVDGAGELLNIIFGLAKRDLVDQKGFQLQKAIPTVLWGHDLEIRRTAQTRVAVRIPCSCSTGAFFLEIHLGPAKPKPQAV